MNRQSVDTAVSNMRPKPQIGVDFIQKNMAPAIKKRVVRYGINGIKKVDNLEYEQYNRHADPHLR